MRILDSFFYFHQEVISNHCGYFVCHGFPTPPPLKTFHISLFRQAELFLEKQT